MSSTDVEQLQREIEEQDEYLVVGIIMPVKQRFAEFYEAASARQAEDLACAQLASEISNGVHGTLWVAGVIQHLDGRMQLADSYACFVDPDEPPLT